MTQEPPTHGKSAHREGAPTEPSSKQLPNEVHDALPVVATPQVGEPEFPSKQAPSGPESEETAVGAQAQAQAHALVAAPATELKPAATRARIAMKKDTRAISNRERAPTSDHSSFHMTVGRAAVGAAAAGLVTSGLTALFGTSVGASLLTLGITAGALTGVATEGRKRSRILMGLGLGLLGGASFVLAGSVWPLFGAILLGAASAPVLARGASVRRKAATALLASGLSYAGLLVARILVGGDILGEIVPSPISTMLFSGVGGMFFGLASAPRHLVRPVDPVESAYAEALAVRDGELESLLGRALQVYLSVRADLAARAEDDATARQLSVRVGDLMMRVLDITKQCRRIEHDLNETPLADLEERILLLTERAASIENPGAAETYRTTAQSLDEQRRSYHAILQGRERVVARLHGNVALLERIRFSLLHMRSAHAERIGEKLLPLSEAVEELGREVDATSIAVSEVYGQTVPKELIHSHS